MFWNAMQSTIQINTCIQLYLGLWRVSNNKKYLSKLSSLRTTISISEGRIDPCTNKVYIQTYITVSLFKTSCKEFSSFFFISGYLTTQCNGGRTVTESYRLESSTAIVYNNNVGCTFTVTSPSGRKILVLFRQFELENKDNGNCLDFVNFHDGVDTSAPVLNSEPLCSNSPPDNVTSSSHVLTLHFVTDSSAVYRGFELLFVVYKDCKCFCCGESGFLHRYKLFVQMWILSWLTKGPEFHIVCQIFLHFKLNGERQCLVNDYFMWNRQLFKVS